MPLSPQPVAAAAGQAAAGTAGKPVPAPLLGSLWSLVARGLFAGMLAGLLAGVVGFVVGEPRIADAIAIEEAAVVAANAGEVDHHGAGTAETGAGHSHGEPGEEPLVSRDGQRFGLFLATGLFGAALGGVLGAVLGVARTRGHLRGASGPRLALAVAALGWLAIEVIPFVKYPANPPAVGDPETINRRTLLWLASVLIGLATVAMGLWVARLVADSSWDSLRLGAPLLVAVIFAAAALAVLPSVDEVGEDFPASLLWQFRAASLAVQATLWLGLGLIYAALTELTARRGVPTGVGTGTGTAG